MELISVVIPLYNKEAYIKRAIRSVLNQSFTNYEIIVVNDGSTDKGLERIQNISDPRVKVISQPNFGVSVARNRGIKEANGDLVAFLDADDTWEPDFLKTVWHLKKKFPEAGAYATAYKIMYPGGKIVVPRFRNIPPPPWEGLIKNYFCSALGPPPICASSVAIPKRIFADVGCFPEGIPLGEDIDMWGRIALKHKIAFSWYQGATYYFYWFGSTRRDSYACMPFVKTGSHAIQRGDVPLSLLNGLNNYINLLKIREASNILVRKQDTKLAREKLRLCNPNNVQLRFLKYWWLFWSFMPNRVRDKLFWAKQKVLRKV